MENLTDISQLLFSLVLVGFLTEAVVEILKTYLFKGEAAKYTFLASLIIGLVLCFALQVSLFEPDNVIAYYIGIVICGLVASRGSNYVHNFLDTMPVKEKK